MSSWLLLLPELDVELVPELPLLPEPLVPVLPLLPLLPVPDVELLLCAAAPEANARTAAPASTRPSTADRLARRLP